MAARSQEGTRGSSCSKYSLILQVSVTGHSQREPCWPHHSSSELRAKAGAGHSFRMRVRGQVAEVQIIGLGAAKVFPIKQDFPEWEQLSPGISPSAVGSWLPMHSFPCETGACRAQVCSSRNCSMGDGRTPPRCRAQKDSKAPWQLGCFSPGRAGQGYFA